MKPSSSVRWLTVRRGKVPLILSMPHTGTQIPMRVAPGLVSPWLARKDTDWLIERLYGFALDLGASLIRTQVSRTAIDCNRDPSGASLYPGQTTTELCPTTTFDGEPLYRACCAPSAEEIAARRREYFDPYHRALTTEIDRLKHLHGAVVLYDCHSIRSQIPRLFAGTLPHFNIGTFAGASCDPRLTGRIEALCDATAFTRVTNGRFKGGYTTRHYGRPEEGVHAVQMELACRGYLREPLGSVATGNWPPPWDDEVAAPMQSVLKEILTTCVRFATEVGAALALRSQES